MLHTSTRHHSRLSVILIICSLTVLPTSATSANDGVLGLWANDDSVLQITQLGESLSAKVIAMADPVYTEEEVDGPPGAPRRDDANPDEALRDRPLLGLELLSQYEFNGKRWEGKIYDPESGNTYSSRMQVNKDGELKMRGYIGVPMLGRTATFYPLSECTETMRQMLALAKLENCKIP